MWSVLSAQIRIPVSDEVFQFLLVVAGLMVFVIMSMRVSRLWKRWGLPAVGVLMVAFLLIMARTGLGFLFTRFGLMRLLLALVDAAVLVWAALVVWGLRRRADALGAVYAALLYMAEVAILVMPMMSMFMGRSSMREMGWTLALARGAYALCLYLGVALVAPRLNPAWLGALVGVGAGGLLGTVVSALIRGAGGPALIASVINPLVVAGLAAAAVYWLKPEVKQRTGS